MATLRPIIRDQNDGLLKELPLSDSLPAGGIVAGVVLFPFVAPAIYNEVSFLYPFLGSGVSDVVVAALTDNDEWGLDDLEGYKIKATALTNEIKFSISSKSPIVGQYRISFIKVSV